MTEACVISILCVDDNASITKALETKLSRVATFAWKGSLSRADDLVAAVAREQPAVVLLDVDMPGKDPFAVLVELSEVCPETRVVMFSGHVRRELVEKAVECGAWGYVSKNDGENELIKAIQRAAQGELALSDEARRVFAM